MFTFSSETKKKKRFHRKKKQQPLAQKTFPAVLGDKNTYADTLAEHREVPSIATGMGSKRTNAMQMHIKTETKSFHIVPGTLGPVGSVGSARRTCLVPAPPPATAPWGAARPASAPATAHGTAAARPRA